MQNSTEWLYFEDAYRHFISVFTVIASRFVATQLTKESVKYRHLVYGQSSIQLCHYDYSSLL